MLWRCLFLRVHRFGLFYEEPKGRTFWGVPKKTGETCKPAGLVAEEDGELGLELAGSFCLMFLHCSWCACLFMLLFVHFRGWLQKAEVLEVIKNHLVLDPVDCSPKVLQGAPACGTFPSQPLQKDAESFGGARPCILLRLGLTCDIWVWLELKGLGGFSLLSQKNQDQKFGISFFGCHPAKVRQSFLSDKAFWAKRRRIWMLRLHNNPLPMLEKLVIKAMEARVVGVLLHRLPQRPFYRPSKKKLVYQTILEIPL